MLQHLRFRGKGCFHLKAWSSSSPNYVTILLLLLLLLKPFSQTQTPLSILQFSSLPLRPSPSPSPSPSLSVAEFAARVMPRPPFGRPPRLATPRFSCVQAVCLRNTFVLSHIVPLPSLRHFFDRFELCQASTFSAFEPY